MNKKHKFLAEPNPTHYKIKNSDPNPTHGLTQPMSISGLYGNYKDAAARVYVTICTWDEAALLASEHSTLAIQQWMNMSHNLWLQTKTGEK